LTNATEHLVAEGFPRDPSLAECRAEKMRPARSDGSPGQSRTVRSRVVTRAPAMLSTASRARSDPAIFSATGGRCAADRPGAKSDDRPPAGPHSRAAESPAPSQGPRAGRPGPRGPGSCSGRIRGGPGRLRFCTARLGCAAVPDTAEATPWRIGPRRQASLAPGGAARPLDVHLGKRGTDRPPSDFAGGGAASRCG
jgi:hypothetical protein